MVVDIQQILPQLPKFVKVDIDAEMLPMALNGGVLEHLNRTISGDEKVINGNEINIVLLDNTPSNPATSVDTDLAHFVEGHENSE